ncbi:Homocysteine S-methyltransferase [Trametes polyzona]|nr:Homocysteine S-methyltransferase [Trametes polyzona]
MAERTNILILDGGLGTTLEDVFHKDISHALWSAKPIDEDPEVIISAHLAFLRAGADIILTSTYQCAFNTFERAGYSRDDARRIMLKSVHLATEARRRFLEETAPKTQDTAAAIVTQPRKVKIALSLGPFGATLSPAQEFDGFYPPPYGPDLSDTAEKTNTFDDTPERRDQERAAIDALADFHYERLSTFAADKETWDAVDLIAFETVPLRREVLAIRKAVARVEAERNGLQSGGAPRMKPWWISTDYPDGRYPEMKPSGGHLAAADVANAALVRDEGAVVWGFGINCTGLEFLPGLLAEVQPAAKAYLEKHGRRPWLVLYPNRGDIYEPKTQSWITKGGEGQKWASGLHAVVEENAQSEVWEGIVVGGCCKTGPEEIALLAQKLRTSPP